MLECSLKMRKECKLWKHCCDCYDSGKLPPCAAESAEKSDNSAMVPCHSWEGAGYNCWIVRGRYCKDKPCLVMAQHQ